MAQQEEPLYDFPEPSQPSQSKLLGHQRGRGSLRSISVLDRLLLTVPVWLQLSINPATALHILRREPPGNFLVRKSRTSQRNVLCVRLADDSVPSFVQQFGIIEEQSNKTLSLETSAISFPDLPRLISFYCVSRDVLPFPLELPDAIAKAVSHKELESISHMGIEFWSSHLNVRGPREAPKPRKDEDKKPDAVPSAPPAAAPQTSSAAQPDSAPQPDNQLNKAPESDTVTKPSGPNTALFHEFCPITTRSPSELDYGSGMGALCFINPLFLQSQNVLCRRRMFKRSLKVRISTETSTPLSPPLAPPPPPPLMPKTKGRCKVQKGGQGAAQPIEGPCKPTIDLTAKDTQPQLQTQQNEVQPPSASPHLQPEMQEQTQIEPDQSKTGVQGKFPTAQLTLTENLPSDSDYMKPSLVINPSQSPYLSPYLSPSVSPMAPPLFPKVAPSISPRDSPGASPSLSPYQSPSLSPKIPFSLSPYDSPSNSPSRSPYDSPSPSPKVPFSLSPFTSLSFSQLTEQVSYTQQASPEREDEEEGASVDVKRDEDGETKEALHKNRGEEEKGLILQMNAASLNDTESCSHEEAAETHSLNYQANGTSL